MTARESVISGNTYLGIEFGSTRIKAVLIDNSFTPIATGAYEWQNSLENGYWTYHEDEFIIGLRSCYRSLAEDVVSKYGVELIVVQSIGISGMMHGYLAFDESFRLLTPFRTWRNTTTGEAATELSELFSFNVPLRWSISHLYQAILNKEEHISRLAHITTLAGYIHYLLTGRFEVGVGEASGIFPIEGNDYDREMMSRASDLFSKHGFERNLTDVLPAVRSAGFKGACLTENGAALLDESGKLKAGIPLCPPEGDAGTGMVATNCIRPGTGSVSAGTSIFSMQVLEKPLNGYYKEIGVVTTPDASPVAMVHCNNCCFELDEWVGMFGEFARLISSNVSKSDLYRILYTNSLEADPSCSGIAAYNYLASEPVAGIDGGRPMYFKESGSSFNLANFFRAQLYSAIAVIRLGADILFEKEKVVPTTILAHGGLFKVRGVAQQYVADAFNTPVAVMSTAGEGGPWGMAILAAYMENGNGVSLSDFLDKYVFGSIEKSVLYPNADGVAGFNRYIERYKSGLAAQKTFN